MMRSLIVTLACSFITACSSVPTYQGETQTNNNLKVSNKVLTTDEASSELCQRYTFCWPNMLSQAKTHQRFISYPVSSSFITSMLIPSPSTVSSSHEQAITLASYNSKTSRKHLESSSQSKMLAPHLFESTSIDSENEEYKRDPSLPLPSDFSPILTESHRSSSENKDFIYDISFGYVDLYHVDQAVEMDAYANDVWERIRQQLTFTVPNKKRVIQEKNWYAKHPDYLMRVSKRAEPYLYFIVEEIERRQLPLELALLPIVESAYNPFAYSHGRAAGIWQFIPGTAKHFGLQQNWWYDGRRDVIASTHAALDYLVYLNKFFKGNWMHALAAYNSGEGNVRKAIRRNKRKNKPTDFWSLKLPRETQAYVPKLLALADLLRNAHSNGLKWRPIPNQKVIDIVVMERPIDLAKAAKFADISVETFFRLNPGYNRWSTSPYGKNHIVLPLDKSSSFKKALEETSPNDWIQFKRYVIKSGDSLGTIAKKHGTTTSMLKKVNHLNSHNIRSGKTLMIPTAAFKMDSYKGSLDQRMAKLENAKPGKKRVRYEVKPGDTFWEIARHYKVSVRTLAKWNGMAPGDPLRINQKLIIWLPNNASSPNTTALQAVASPHLSAQKIRYTVKRGDSLSRISSKFNVSVKELISWNQLNGSKYLQPGQKLILFIDPREQYKI
ncbi:MAG: LysM peptidoglycan-binding domain-containing protein [Pseudomonadota bacterium]